LSLSFIVTYTDITLPDRSGLFNSRQGAMKILGNYLTLVERVDDLCLRATDEFRAHIACRAGCAGCCRHLSLFPVEAVALARALNDLPAEQAARIRGQAEQNLLDAPCPLLVNDHCLLYTARPIICRTHGLPLLTTQVNGKQLIDFCPLNFQGLDSLPGSAIIDLDRLNTTLAAINALFVAEWYKNTSSQKERIPMVEALSMVL
jgi:hypothetical protein